MNFRDVDADVPGAETEAGTRRTNQNGERPLFQTVRAVAPISSRRSWELLQRPGINELAIAIEAQAALQRIDFVTSTGATSIEATPVKGDRTVRGFGEAQRSTMELVDQLLRTSPRPTGLFVPSDEAAIRLYSALRHHGAEPGREMAVVSCDNQSAWLRQMEPRPVSIDLGFALMGERAVEQLLQRMSHPGQRPGTRILIPPQLDEQQ